MSKTRSPSTNFQTWQRRCGYHCLVVDFITSSSHLSVFNVVCVQRLSLSSTLTAKCSCGTSTMIFCTCWFLEVVCQTRQSRRLTDQGAGSVESSSFACIATLIEACLGNFHGVVLGSTQKQLSTMTAQSDLSGLGDLPQEMLNHGLRTP